MYDLRKSPDPGGCEGKKPPVDRRDGAGAEAITSESRARIHEETGGSRSRCPLVRMIEEQDVVNVPRGLREQFEVRERVPVPSQ